jgi:hypothetical protein
MPSKKVTDIFITVANDAVGSQVVEGDEVRIRTATSVGIPASVFIIAPVPPQGVWKLLHLRIQGFDFWHAGGPAPSFRVPRLDAALTIDPNWKYQYKIVNE